MIESVSSRKTTKLGTGYFVTTRMDVRVGEDLVGTHRFRILKYAPAADAESRQENRPEKRPPAPAPSSTATTPASGRASGSTGCSSSAAPAAAPCASPGCPGCNACGCPDWDTVEASGEGTVYSYVVMHHPPFPAFATCRYAVALIELAEGVRMISNVVGVPYDKVRIGMPVRLEFRRVRRGVGAARLPPPGGGRMNRRPYETRNRRPYETR